MHERSPVNKNKGSGHAHYLKEYEYMDIDQKGIFKIKIPVGEYAESVRQAFIQRIKKYNLNSLVKEVKVMPWPYKEFEIQLKGKTAERHKLNYQKLREAFISTPSNSPKISSIPPDGKLNPPTLPKHPQKLPRTINDTVVDEKGVSYTYTISSDGTLKSLSISSEKRLPNQTTTSSQSEKFRTDGFVPPAPPLFEPISFPSLEDTFQPHSPPEVTEDDLIPFDIGTSFPEISNLESSFSNSQDILFAKKRPAEPTCIPFDDFVKIIRAENLNSIDDVALQLNTTPEKLNTALDNFNSKYNINFTYQNIKKNTEAVDSFLNNEPFAVIDIDDEPPRKKSKI